MRQFIFFMSVLIFFVHPQPLFVEGQSRNSTIIKSNETDQVSSGNVDTQFKHSGGHVGGDIKPGGNQSIPKTNDFANKLELDKKEKEIRRLELLNQKLDREHKRPFIYGPLATPISALVGALIGATGAILAARWVAHINRFSPFDQAVQQKRLYCYPDLVGKTKPLSLYFPHGLLSPAVCGEIGKGLRKCYFSGTGILLSKSARDMYFAFIHGLTLASKVKSLCVPELDQYALWINKDSVSKYQKVLEINLYDEKKKAYINKLAGIVKNWEFGNIEPNVRSGLDKILKEEKLTKNEGASIENSALPKNLKETIRVYDKVVDFVIKDAPNGTEVMQIIKDSIEIVEKCSIENTSNDDKNILRKVKNIKKMNVGEIKNANVDTVKNWLSNWSSTQLPKMQDEAAAHLFKDFLLIQTLSSRLRTELAEDLKSRRRLAL